MGEGSGFLTYRSPQRRGINSTRGLDSLGTPADVRALFDSASIMTAGGLINDSILAIGWQNGRGPRAQDHLGFVSIDHKLGKHITGVPGWVLGIDSESVWIVRDQTADSNIVEAFTCQDSPIYTRRENPREFRFSYRPSSVTR